MNWVTIQPCGICTANITNWLIWISAVIPLLYVRTLGSINKTRQLYINATNDVLHPYSLNFADYMPSSRISGIAPSSVQGFLDDNSEVETVYSGGIASFAHYPEKITYDYMVGFNGLSMDVTIIAPDAYNDVSLRNHVYSLYTDQPIGMEQRKGILRIAGWASCHYY